MNIPGIHRLLLPLFALATTCQVFASEQGASSPPPSRFRQAPTTLDGRIFFSIAERRALEIKPVAPAVPVIVATPPVKRRFDGMLWRDGRIVTLWFDGDSVDPATEPAIRLGDDIPVTMVSGRRQTLLPGQSWLLQDKKAEP